MNFKLLIKSNFKYFFSFKQNCINFIIKHYSNSKHIDILVAKRILNISTGQLARFADGSAVAKIGETSVLSTVVSKNKNSQSYDFFPLTVDYRQKSSTAGKIPTNYLRREYGASEREILIGRMIDRSLRPFFPTGYLQETQVVCNLLSLSPDYDPAVISINAASAALFLSDVPWSGPIGAVQVGFLDNKILINPTRQQLSKSRLNMIIAASRPNKMVMVDASAENLPYSDFQSCIKEGVEHAQEVINGIEHLKNNIELKKNKRLFIPPDGLSEKMTSTLKSLVSVEITKVFQDSSHDKISRDNAIREIKEKYLIQFKNTYPEIDNQLYQECFSKITKSIFRELIFSTQLRCDGRDLTSLRSISCQINLYPSLHGSALFQRGQTQVFCSTTLDSPESAAKIDSITSFLSGIKEKNFFLHYEFPPYATNEIGRMGSVGRRELGHGALAEKAIRPIVPNCYPFTIRLCAEVFESNGSSSMASVCAGSLSLLDAGVPISEAVAGIAIGLVTEREEMKHLILTDQLGIEDYMGDMDFKLAGTKQGVTALHADIKLMGIDLNIAIEAVNAAKDGIEKILAIMNRAIDKPKEVSKPNHPVIENIDIPIAKRAKFLGIGGLNIKKLMEETGVTLTPQDDNIYQIFAPNQWSMNEAKIKIEELLIEEKEPLFEFGAIYRVKILELKDFGVMVQLHPSMSPILIHNSQLDTRKVEHPSILNLQVGQELSVKYFGRDPATGKIRLSRKVLQYPSISIIKSFNKEK